MIESSQETQGMSQDCARGVPFTLAITGIDLLKGTRAVTIYPPLSEYAEDFVVQTIGKEPVLRVAEHLINCHYANQCSGSSEKCVVMKRRKR